jgi:hypothetical protein
MSEKQFFRAYRLTEKQSFAGIPMNKAFNGYTTLATNSRPIADVLT